MVGGSAEPIGPATELDGFTGSVACAVQKAPGPELHLAAEVVAAEVGSATDDLFKELAVQIHLCATRKGSE